MTFNTLVYDTNVGDISSLATYFNPDRISERELNLRFGHYPAASGGEEQESPQKAGLEDAVKPRLLLYPDHNLNPNQVTFKSYDFYLKLWTSIVIDAGEGSENTELGVS